MLNCLCSTWFLVNVILGILLVEYALFKTKSVRKVDEARDSKFPAFRRWDVKLWSRARLYLASPLLPFRFFSAIFQVIIHLTVTKIVVSIGSRKHGEPLAPW